MVSTKNSLLKSVCGQFWGDWVYIDSNACVCDIKREGWCSLKNTLPHKALSGVVCMALSGTKVANLPPLTMTPSPNYHPYL